MKISENKDVYTLKRVQLICPNCKHEFPYNKIALDKRINLIGQLIFEKGKLIKKIKKIPDNIRNDGEIKRLEKEKEYYKLMISDLKFKRELLKKQEDDVLLKNLKDIVKETYGEEQYKKCLDEALKRSEAYDIKDTMGINFYTRTGGKHLKKV